MEAEKMELRLINPTENNFLEHIEWNSEEIKAQVQAIMETYNGMVYTEDTMKLAKEDRATLNKFKKIIEDRRKEVKKKCLEPYERFETEVKDILAIIEEPIGIIDGQIKSFENQQKEEKKQKLIDAYNERIGELGEILPFDRVFDTRYLNATFALSKAIQEITEKVTRVGSDLQTIDGMESEFKLNVRDVYIQTLDLSKAMAEDRRLREMKERMEAERRAKEEAEAARIAKAEQERAAREEAARLEAEKASAAKNETENAQSDNENAASDNENVQNETENAQNETPTEPQSDIGKTIAGIERQAFEQAATPAEDTRLYKASFWCKGTKAQISGVLEYMRNNGISYGRVDK